jgi:hypothetical protein
MKIVSLSFSNKKHFKDLYTSILSFVVLIKSTMLSSIILLLDNWGGYLSNGNQSGLKT